MQELAHLLQNAFRGPSPQVQENIQKLQSEVDTYSRKIDMEKRRADELQQQLQIYSARLLEQRKDMGGINAPQENKSLVGIIRRCHGLSTGHRRNALHS